MSNLDLSLMFIITMHSNRWIYMLHMNEQILVNLPVAFHWQVIWAAMKFMCPSLCLYTY